MKYRCECLLGVSSDHCVWMWKYIRLDHPSVGCKYNSTGNMTRNFICQEPSKQHECQSTLVVASQRLHVIVPSPMFLIATEADCCHQTLRFHFFPTFLSVHLCICLFPHHIVVSIRHVFVVCRSPTTARQRDAVGRRSMCPAAVPHMRSTSAGTVGSTHCISAHLISCHFRLA